MSDGFTLDVGEITKALAEFKQLPAVLQGPLARGAAKAVMTELRDRAIKNAPQSAGPEGSEAGPPPGNLKRALYCMRLPELCSPGKEVWKVDARKGAGRWKHKRNLGKDTNTEGAYYAGWVEFGHYTRTPRVVLLGGKGTRNRRREEYQSSGKARWVPAQPYMRPALDSMKNTAGSIMQTYIDRNLPEALRTFKYMKTLNGG